MTTSPPFRVAVRDLLLMSCLVMTAPVVAPGQALDIGGIELHIGQDVTAALNSLGPYQVRYDDGLKSWFVSQSVAGEPQWLGHFGAVDGKVSFISKGFRLSDAVDTPRVYTLASQEVRRRGGPSCVTREVTWSDGLVHEIETRCGSYRLVLSFPYSMNRDRTVTSGISITVGQGQ